MLSLFKSPRISACPSATVPDQPQGSGFDHLAPLRHWLNSWDISHPAVAHAICRMVPVKCPFERDICLFGRVLVHIPPLCKLNPLYEEVVGLRFRALCYLADECNEDVRRYCLQ